MVDDGNSSGAGAADAKPLDLSFPFRDRRVPVNYVSSVTAEQAKMAILSEPFITWYKRCEKVSTSNKRLELHSVTIQSVDLFGAR